MDILNFRAKGHHRWRFFRAGGFDQVRIETGADLASLASFDQKLWMALSCPTDSVEFDAHTLALLDTDGDKRVRAPELLAAIEWTLRMVKDADALFKSHTALPLDLIDDSHEEGAALLKAATNVLASIGRGAEKSIAPAAMQEVAATFAKTRFNGDGILPSAAADTPEDKAAIEQVMAALGSRPDKSGLPGIGMKELDAFVAAAEAFLAWHRRAAAEAALRPAGEGTDAAVAAYLAIRGKLEDYFTRARLAAFDPGKAAALNPRAEDFAALAGRDLSADTDALRGLPLAHIAPGQPLPLSGGVNPAWSTALDNLRDAVILPLLGARESLSEADWRAIDAKLQPAIAWRETRPAGPVSAIPAADLAAFLEHRRPALETLIKRDEALAPEADSIAAVDKLAHFVRDLVPFVNNFVSFADFYSRRGKAIFQVGTLYIDGRAAELCIRINDPAKHAPVAALGRIYLIYCECQRRGSDEKMFIAAAITAGDSDQLMVGRNGVFYDRKGQDWHASVIRIVEHPISIRQAFWLPFKRVGRFVSDQMEKFASARGKTAEDNLAVGLTNMTKLAPDPKAPAPAAASAAAPPPPAFDAGRFAGIFAAIGLAIGALGTALASVVTGFLSLKWWQIPLAVIGALLVVSGPSMLIAAMKLRQRNLGPILDANGWAVNARAFINIPFGGALTTLGKLPPGAERALTDPFAEKKRPWFLYLAIILLIVALGLAVYFQWPPQLWARL